MATVAPSITSSLLTARSGNTKIGFCCGPGFTSCTGAPIELASALAAPPLRQRQLLVLEAVHCSCVYDVHLVSVVSQNLVTEFHEHEDETLEHWASVVSSAQLRNATGWQPLSQRQEMSRAQPRRSLLTLYVSQCDEQFDGTVQLRESTMPSFVPVACWLMRSATLRQVMAAGFLLTSRNDRMRRLRYWIAAPHVAVHCE
mmetsp:Transcript_21654/g.67215  ORF Transcript_21654/g.67215 Transcript_21654/m.67215 type:complete len:200 (-) Transcript_21654:168-767(-)